MRRIRARSGLTAIALSIAMIMAGGLTAAAASAPPTPANVTATPTNSSTIHVSWSSVSGASYVLSNGNTTKTIAAGTTSYDWTGLAQGTYMCFTVAAKNSSGQSAWSPYSCATTAVAAPKSVTATPSTAKIHVSWIDTSGGKASFVVSNGNVSTADLPPGTAGFDWTGGATTPQGNGLPMSTYMCFTVAAKQGNGQSPWTSYACATTTSGDPTRDSLISRLQNPQTTRFGMTDSLGRTMDSAKIVQAGSTYYAVYSPHSQSVVLASASSLYGTWTPLATLDDDNASQPYLAAQSNGTYILADEYAHPGVSTVNFKHYVSLTALRSGTSDHSYDTYLSLSGCHEGTPDIHSTDPTTIQVGFHYNAGCLSDQRDQEAYGTLTRFPTTDGTDPTWTETADTVKDNALDNAVTPWSPGGYPGKHGARDDFVWQGHRYSLTEAQNSADTGGYANWRLALYDYGNDTAYPVVLSSSVPTCAAVPRVAPLTDTDGQSVLIVTAFIYGECTSTEGGEMTYIVPAA